MAKAVDLKCEETLRESPPPSHLAETSVAGGASSSTYSVYVTKKFDQKSTSADSAHQKFAANSPSTDSFGVGKHQTTKLDVSKQHQTVTPFISPFSPLIQNVSYFPVNRILQPPVFSSVFSNVTFDQSFQSLTKNVSPSIKLPFEHPEHLPGSRDSKPKTNLGISGGVVNRSQPSKSSMATVDSQPSQSSRPVTLHINTNKGTAVVQLQHSTVSPSSKNTMSISTSKRNTTSDIQPVPTSVISRASTVLATPTTSIHNLPSRSIYPSPISLPPTAAAATAFYQDLSSYQPFATSLHYVANASAKLNSVPLSLSSGVPYVIGGGGGSASRALLSGVAAATDSSLLKPRSSPLKPQSSPGNFTGSFSAVSPSSSHFLATATAASTSSTTQQQQAGGQSSSSANSNQGGNGNGAAAATTPGQSPRPSILRKRPSEVNAVSSVSKKLTYDNVGGGNNAQTPRKLVDVPSSGDEIVISTTRAPEHPDAGNSNHSSSASTISAGSVVDGQSISSFADNNVAGGGHNTVSPSPRKRPRKQCLDDLPEAGSVSGESEDDRLSTETIVANENLTELPEEQIVAAIHEATKKAESAKATKSNAPWEKRTDVTKTSADATAPVARRPRPSLWSTGETTWHPRRNHFQRYDDVKRKDERKATVNELCNQKQILQKIEPWRLTMISGHFDDLAKCEQTNIDDLLSVLTTLDEQEDDDLLRVELESAKEMVLTSVQRCKAVKEFLSDVKQPLNGILKHKRNVENLIHKYGSNKRGSRKKDKNRADT